MVVAEFELKQREKQRTVVQQWQQMAATWRKSGVEKATAVEATKAEEADTAEEQDGEAAAEAVQWKQQRQQQQRTWCVLALSADTQVDW